MGIIRAYYIVKSSRKGVIAESFKYETLEGAMDKAKEWVQGGDDEALVFSYVGRFTKVSPLPPVTWEAAE